MRGRADERGEGGVEKGRGGGGGGNRRAAAGGGGSCRAAAEANAVAARRRAGDSAGRTRRRKPEKREARGERARQLCGRAIAGLREELWSATGRATQARPPSRPSQHAATLAACRRDRTHLIDEPLGRLAGLRASARCQRVELVEEEDAGGRGLCAREQLPHGALALAHVFVEQLGSLDGDEVGAGRVGSCLGDQRLSAACVGSESGSGLCHETARAPSCRAGDEPRCHLVLRRLHRRRAAGRATPPAGHAPGGPKRSTPEPRCRPIWEKRSGCAIGLMTANSSSSRTCEARVKGQRRGKR